MYIVGKISDKSVVMKSGIYHSDNPSLGAILTNVVHKYGGDGEDYSVLFLNDKSTIVNDIVFQNAEYELLWNEDILTNVTTSAWQEKDITTVSADKYTISATGTDVTTIVCNVLSGNTNEIDKTFTKMKEILVNNPFGDITISADFINGICNYPFATSASGIYTIPSVNFDDEEIRIGNKIKIKVE